MVLQSNPRIRNAKSNEGKSYIMGGVTYMGSGRKAGTGRSATTRYNVKFLKDMGACCKAYYTVEAFKAIKVWRALDKEYKQLSVALKATTAGNAWTTGPTARDKTEFDTVTNFTAIADASELTSKVIHANRQDAKTRCNQIPDNLEVIRAAWHDKQTGNPATGNVLPVLKGNLTAANLVANFPDIA